MVRAVQDEHGSGTVLALGVIAVALVLCLGASALMRSQGASGQAQAAADLAAISGATALTSVYHPDDPCQVATRVARANGAELTGCQVDGGRDGGRGRADPDPGGAPYGRGEGEERPGGGRPLSRTG